MFKCVCGKEFENRISCSRHKSTCRVYLSTRTRQKRTFSEEGKDHIVCKYCGYKARDITKHLSTALPPHPDRASYRIKYPDQKLVCSDVEDTRKKTNKVLHGDENYRNPEAQRRGILRAFSQKKVLEKIKRTKKQRYGDPGYVNLEKRKKTLLEKYGVDNAMKDPDVVRRSLETKKILYEDNPVRREPLIQRDELVRRHHKMGETLAEIARDLSVTPEAVSYWMKKFGIDVHKRVAVPKKKEYIRPRDTVKEYFEECASAGYVLSFGEYGYRTGDKKKLRLKRLFNKGRPFHHLLEELKRVALDPEPQSDFLKKLSE